MLECPRCGNKSTRVLKVWDYAMFHVRYIRCERCKKNFRAYFKGDKLSYTLPRALSVTELKISKYLKLVKNATEEEIANALRLNIKHVEPALVKLKKMGVVEESNDKLSHDKQ